VINSVEVSGCSNFVGLTNKSHKVGTTAHLNTVNHWLTRRIVLADDNNLVSYTMNSAATCTARAIRYCFLCLSVYCQHYETNGSYNTVEATVVNSISFSVLIQKIDGRVYMIIKQ